ncbi:addiction module protein [Duganella phyllosphaerae]|uniref:Putative addiction module component n=1 Tax=Duganella phyllosphaerae TaxID=762836 RepID=A0A1E7WC01_9BURK|nr:addiction module protein [Duganella phyllosphaerae]OEZ94516.1 putative addiction module component [Duganella phyllosphaerae]
MQTPIELITTEAMKLTTDEREAIVQVLIASLENDAPADEALAAEVERRIAEIENGTVKAIPVDEALAQIRASLK